MWQPMSEDINGDNDTSTVDCRLIWKRGGGEIPMLSAKTPVNVVKLKENGRRNFL